MSEEKSKSNPVHRESWEYNCEHCSRDFSGDMAHQIVVRGPHEADIMCPWCRHIAPYHAPEEVERPPAMVGTSIVTSGGQTTARMFFEGGAWLQYSETNDGRVREEMFNVDGEQIESFNAEIEHDDCDRSELYDSPEEYLQRAVDRYEKYTIKGLEIQRPHIAAVLINDH